MKSEIEHAGSCLGTAGGTGRLIVRRALADGHSVVVLVPGGPPPGLPREQT